MFTERGVLEFNLGTAFPGMRRGEETPFLVNKSKLAIIGLPAMGKTGVMRALDDLPNEKYVVLGAASRNPDRLGYWPERYATDILRRNNERTNNGIGVWTLDAVTDFWIRAISETYKLSHLSSYEILPLGVGQGLGLDIYDGGIVQVGKYAYFLCEQTGQFIRVRASELVDNIDNFCGMTSEVRDQLWKDPNIVLPAELQFYLNIYSGIVSEFVGDYLDRHIAHPKLILLDGPAEVSYRAILQDGLSHRADYADKGILAAVRLVYLYLAEKHPELIQVVSICNELGNRLTSNEIAEKIDTLSR